MKTHESGVDQLIQRVKSEGLEKAQQERDEIIRRAKHEASIIEEKARLEARAIINDAQTLAAAEKRKLRMELTLAARDFSIKLRERLSAQMMFPIIKENVRATLKEPDFLKEVLVRLVNDALKHNLSNVDVLVSKELKTTLAAFFASSICDAIDKNYTISLKDEDGLEGFILVNKGTNCVWDFSADTVAEELMRLIEPNLHKYFMAQGEPAAC